jgi:hypothetical protein
MNRPKAESNVVYSADDVEDSTLHIFALFAGRQKIRKTPSAVTDKAFDGHREQ